MGNAYELEMRISGECVSVRNADQVKNVDQPGRMRISLDADQWIIALSINSTLGAPPPLTGNGNMAEFFFREINGKKGKNILYSIFLKY